MTTKVLFVCLGNICRSPTAHAVFEKKLIDAGLSEIVSVDSAGTGGWHKGEAPDTRAVQAARESGYDLSPLRARQVQPEDFLWFNYIVAMDKQNMDELEKIRPSGSKSELKLFLDYAKKLDLREVPDPYFGEKDGFAQVLSLIEQASDGLVAHILMRHKL